MVWLPVFGIFNVRTDVSTLHTGAVHADSVRESALGGDSGMKIPSRIGDLKTRVSITRDFSRTLYQLSYPRPKIRYFLFD